MIQVTLVTGFLGAGKTTLLERMNRVLPAGTVYLVNEFSPRDVDGRRLELPAGKLEIVSGGSIFCRCKVMDFINAMQRVAQQYSDCPGMVIEASGIADPAVFPRLLAETGLDKHYALCGILCVIDPGTLPKLLCTLPNVRNQIAAATLLIINKTDLFPSEMIEDARKRAREINPTARLLPAVRCAIDPVELLAETGSAPENLRGEYAKCADPNYSSLTLLLRREVDWPALRGAIGSRVRGLYRAKGCVPVAGGALEVDYSGGRWQEVTTQRPAEGELILIATGADEGPLMELRMEWEENG